MNYGQINFEELGKKNRLIFEETGKELVRNLERTAKKILEQTLQGTEDYLKVINGVLTHSLKFFSHFSTVPCQVPF